MMTENYWVMFSANTPADQVENQIEILRMFSVGNFEVKYNAERESFGMLNKGTFVSFDTTTDAEEIEEATECGLDEFLTKKFGE